MSDTHRRLGRVNQGLTCTRRPSSRPHTVQRKVKLPLDNMVSKERVATPFYDIRGQYPEYDKVAKSDFNLRSFVKEDS